MRALTLIPYTVEGFKPVLSCSRWPGSALSSP
jgi:hypothetical protein